MKRLFSMILAAVLVLSMFGAAFAASPKTDAKLKIYFTDMADKMIVTGKVVETTVADKLADLKKVGEAEYFGTEVKGTIKEFFAWNNSEEVEFPEETCKIKIVPLTAIAKGAECTILTSVDGQTWTAYDATVDQNGEVVAEAETAAVAELLKAEQVYTAVCA